MLQIATKDAKCHGFEPEAGTRVTANLDDVITDADLDIVVEAMGGIEPAKSIFLNSKAHIVTANKALLANEFPAINKAFRSKKRGQRRLGYEASVAGGVPIIRALQSSLLSDTIHGVAGIMNGTTNFILSKMAAEGKAYADVLKEAQEAGFAEADPTADVEGHDARNKLVLLTALTTGLYVPPSKIRTTGITCVSDWDFDAVSRLGGAGYTIKLLGSVTRFSGPAGATASTSDEPSQGSNLLDLLVSPSVVSKESAFGLTNGAMNLVRVHGENTGVTAYYGAGAGRYATANSIVADMLNIAKGTSTGPAFPRPTPKKLGTTLRVQDSHKRDWYIRGPGKVLEAVGLSLWRQGMGVSPIIGGPDSASTKAILANGASHAEISGLLRRLSSKAENSADVSGVVCFPVVGDKW